MGTPKITPKMTPNCIFFFEFINRSWYFLFEFINFRPGRDFIEGRDLLIQGRDYEYIYIYIYIFRLLGKGAPKVLPRLQGCGAVSSCCIAWPACYLFVLPNAVRSYHAMLYFSAACHQSSTAPAK